jgi:hypothetical protein
MSFMAIQRIKATYSLDAGTVRELERLARRWETSKSEALRRAIRAAAAAEARRKGTVSARIAAFDRLQDSLALPARVAEAWVRSTRAERRASSKRRGY